MNPQRRPPRPRSEDDAGRRRRAPPPSQDGTNSVQSRPDPRAEPIPDGEHKYVPRSPYRTGNY